MAKKIDVHTHLYPRSYMELLVKHGLGPVYQPRFVV